MTATYSALGPATVGVMAVLNVAAMTSIATGGVHSDVPQNAVLPYVLFSVDESTEGTLGTKPGQGAMLLIDLRVEAIAVSLTTAKAMIAKAVQLLTAAPIAVDGFTFCGLEPFHDSSRTVRDEHLIGVKDRSAVATFRFYLEEAA